MTSAARPSKPLAQKPSKARSRWFWGLVAIGILAVFGILFPQIKGQLFAKVSTHEGLIGETAKRGPFQITVTERGTLDSLRNAVLTSKVEGSTTIIHLIPEGTQVNEGDLLVELDSSALNDKKIQQSIVVTQAVAATAQAKENLAIQETQNQSDISAAKLKVELAELDLKKFEKGEYQQQLNELTGQVTLAKENVGRAEENYDFAYRLTKKGYKTQNDLETARIAVTKEQIALEVAQEKLRVFEEFNYHRTLAELQANARESVLELKRVERKANAATSQKVAELRSKELTEQVEKTKLERLEQQIRYCQIRAPQDGQVVYANSRDSRSSDAVLIEEGASVRERQAIINLPDFDNMKVNARIHESRISLVKQGLPATVKVDAYPDEVFHGDVFTVSSVPMSSNSFSRDVKEYEAIVRLTDDSERVNKLRPGLTASIEIMVEQRDEVLQSPVQSIITIGPRQFVYVMSAESVKRREITIGQTNDRMVEIVSGLEENERVVMNPRSHFAKELGELEVELSKQFAAEKAHEHQDSIKHQKPATDAEPSKPGARSPDADRTKESSTGPRRKPDAESSSGERSPAGDRLATDGNGPPSGGPGGPNRDPVAFFNRLDKNHDGKLTEDELDDRMKSRFATWDANGDGTVTETEFKEVAAKFPARPPRGEAGGN